MKKPQVHVNPFVTLGRLRSTEAKDEKKWRCVQVHVKSIAHAFVSHLSSGLKGILPQKTNLVSSPAKQKPLPPKNAFRAIPKHSLHTETGRHASLQKRFHGQDGKEKTGARWPSSDMPDGAIRKGHSAFSFSRRSFRRSAFSKFIQLHPASQPEKLKGSG
jgi:hypothetical protein